MRGREAEEGEVSASSRRSEITAFGYGTHGIRNLLLPKIEGQLRTVGDSEPVVCVAYHATVDSPIPIAVKPLAKPRRRSDIVNPTIGGVFRCC